MKCTNVLILDNCDDILISEYCQEFLTLTNILVTRSKFQLHNIIIIVSQERLLYLTVGRLKNLISQHLLKSLIR